jgi:transcriptional regulator CtsR
VAISSLYITETGDTMSVLADKIEQFILHKLLEDEEENIVLRRNELADELECAPSQISYVLSTRFSNDKGYLVESRRGSGGFVRIIRLAPKKVDRTPAPIEERLPAINVTMEDLDVLLYRLIKNQTLTNREAILLHHTFEAIYETVDEPNRLDLITKILSRIKVG